MAPKKCSKTIFFAITCTRDQWIARTRSNGCIKSADKSAGTFRLQETKYWSSFFGQRLSPEDPDPYGSYVDRIRSVHWSLPSILLLTTLLALVIYTNRESLFGNDRKIIHVSKNRDQSLIVNSTSDIAQSSADTDNSTNTSEADSDKFIVVTSDSETDLGTDKIQTSDWNTDLDTVLDTRVRRTLIL